ncbi:MAG: hypothetical protein ACFE92_17390 [Promethearchaeota archaeon]
MGKISGDVELTYGKLSIILGRYEDYVYHMRKYILSQTNRRYNPNYKLDLETFEDFKTALRMLLKEKIIPINFIIFYEFYLIDVNKKELCYEKKEDYCYRCSRL